MRKLTEALNPTIIRAQQAAGRDPVWVIWQYDAETWRRHDKWILYKVQRHTLFFVVFGLAWALLWAFIPAFTSTQPGPLFGNLLERWAPIVVSVGVLGWAGLPYWHSWQLHQARLRGPAEIRIGPLAINEPGGAIPIFGPSLSWRIVGLDALSPPMHTLRAVEIEQGRPSYLRFSGWAGWSWPTTVYVPIPAGQETAAAALVIRFRQEILDQSSTIDHSS